MLTLMRLPTDAQRRSARIAVSLFLVIGIIWVIAALLSRDARVPELVLGCSAVLSACVFWIVAHRSTAPLIVSVAKLFVVLSPNYLWRMACCS